MKNENVTITLPKDKYDNLTNLVDSQEKQLKELLSAKKDDIIIIERDFIRTGMDSTMNLPTITSGNQDKIRRLLFDKLSLTRESVEAAFQTKIDLEKQLEETSFTLRSEIIEYNSLPWWKKIFSEIKIPTNK